MKPNESSEPSISSPPTGNTTVKFTKIRPTSGSKSYLTRLPTSWLAPARLLWIVLSCILIGVLIFAIPARYNILLQTYQQGDRPVHQLTPQEVPILESWNLSVPFYAAYSTLFEVLQAIGFILVGLVIFARRSNHWQGLFISFALVTFGIAYPPTVRSFAVFGGVIPVFVFSLGNTVFVAFAYTFPDGKFVPPWTRYFVAAVAAWALALVLFPQLNVISWSAWVRFGLVGGLTIPCIIAQIHRYRYVSTPTERMQTKWIVFSTALLIISFTLDGVIRTIPIIGQPGPVHLMFNLLVAIPLLETAVGILVPVFIGFAILRYRLWDIDVLLNRALVYTALTGILSLIYFASTILLQQLFFAYTGAQQSSLAIALTTLLIAALFQPVRRRLWALLGRRMQVAKLVRSANSPVIMKDATKDPVVNGPLTGSRLGNYEVREVIGRGGMAEVYKGWHEVLHRTVAIKTLTGHLSADHSFRRRFEREAQTVATLQHPHIVQVFDFGVANDVYYMVMQYIDGANLAKYLKTNGPLPLPEVITLIQDIASALDYAHERGIVHRDIKPSNVMLQPLDKAENTEEGAVKAVLTDFGLARLLTGASTQTGTGTLGTLGYMAPEQIDSSKKVGPSTDVYGLGVMVYEMLTGRLPFADENVAALLLAHLQRPAPDPRQVAPNLPKHVALAVLQALAKDPEDRYQSASAFIAALTL